MNAAYHIDTTVLADPGPVRFMPRIFIADPPCVDCRYSEGCATQLLACRQFAQQYTNFGKWDDSKPRRPSRKLYERVFSEDDD